MPSLPYELERLIFELAALQDTNRHNRMQIMLVAKRVYEWIRPILYRVLIVSDLTAFIHWRYAKGADTARFVRHLSMILNTNLEESQALKLVSNFRNVENLAIWGNAISPEILKEISDLPLRTLHAGLEEINLDVAVKDCRAFRNLTHLGLGSKGKTWEHYKPLIELPKLTHLLIEHLFGRGDLDDVVKGLLNLKGWPSSSLRVLVYWMGPGEYMRPCSIKYDPRLLVIQSWFSLGNWVVEWDNSANGQIGYWEVADLIMEARNGRLFKDNSSFIFPVKSWMRGLNDDGIRWYNEHFK